MNAKKGWKRTGWFPAVILLLSLAKLWMIRGLVIYPLPEVACDDGLMANWALNIASGGWTGPFSDYIFTKEVGFALYLAALNLLGLPYIFTTNLLYLAGCLVLLYAVSHVVQKKWVLCVIYAVLLFHPIMTAVDTGQRVYRNGFGTALTLLIFGSLLNLYFEMEQKSFGRNFLWAALAAGSLGFLWETKSDTVWILPFALAVLAVTAGVLIKKRKSIKIFPKLFLVFFPFLGILISSKSVELLNTRAYGSSGIAYYGPALDLLTGVESEDSAENISLSRETFYRLCQYSPTLASVKEEVEQAMDRCDPHDTHPGDGNVEDGWIGWALIGAVDSAGYYKDLETANQFYREVYEELNRAVEQGDIRLREKSVLDACHMASSAERKELFGTMGEIWRFVAGCGGMFSDICELSGDDIEGAQTFERLTGNHACYEAFDTDYYCEGWIVYPNYDLGELEVYIEDAEGSQYVRLDFEESADVKEGYPDVRGADQCRFLAKWNGTGKDHTEFYIAAYQDGQKVINARITKKGLADVKEEDCIGSVDSFFQKEEQQATRAEAVKAVKRCNGVSSLYAFFGGVLAWAGAAAYGVFTLLSAAEWKKRRYDTVNLWLVITGIGLSLLVLFAGVAVTHLEKCPAVSYMYLSAAYPLFSLDALLSLAGCAASLNRRIRRYRGMVNHQKVKRS